MEKGFEIKCLDHGFVRLVDWMGSDQRIVEFARVSYRSASKGVEQDRKLLEFLWKNRHTSPFESCQITFDIKMPIFVARQYFRHRTQHANEVSARYTELPNEFYIPTSWRKQDVKNKQGSVVEENWDPDLLSGFDTDGIEHSITATKMVKDCCNEAYYVYQKLLEAGVARELARMVLPVNIYTEIYSCWDLKNLLHFIALREDSHAQAEIVVYAKAIKYICTQLFPMTLAAYEKYKWELKE